MGKIATAPNGFITMPKAVQRQFVALASEMVESTQQMADSIDELETDLKPIQDGLVGTTYGAGESGY